MVESPDQDLFPHLDAEPGAGVFYSPDKNYLPADQVSLIERTIERIQLLYEHVAGIKTQVSMASKYLDILAWLDAFDAEMVAAKLKLMSVNDSAPNSTVKSTPDVPFPPEAPGA